MNEENKNFNLSRLLSMGLMIVLATSACQELENPNVSGEFISMAGETEGNNGDENSRNLAKVHSRKNQNSTQGDGLPPWIKKTFRIKYNNYMRNDVIALRDAMPRKFRGDVTGTTCVAERAPTVKRIGNIPSVVAGVPAGPASTTCASDRYKRPGYAPCVFVADFFVPDNIRDTYADQIRPDGGIEFPAPIQDISEHYLQPEQINLETWVAKWGKNQNRHQTFDYLGDLDIFCISYIEALHELRRQVATRVAVEMDRDWHGGQPILQNRYLANFIRAGARGNRTQILAFLKQIGTLAKGPSSALMNRFASYKDKSFYESQKQYCEQRWNGPKSRANRILQALELKAQVNLPDPCN